MKQKMSIKSKLVLQSGVALYLLIVFLLYKLNVINPDKGDSMFIQGLFEIMMVAIFFYNENKLSGITDELGISILSKVNKIGMNFLVISIVIFSYRLTSPAFTIYKELVISKFAIGVWLMIIIFIFTIIRLLSFMYYDKKGLCK